jgi:hypothetical protein
MARMLVAYTQDGISGTMLSEDSVTAESSWSLAFGLLFGAGFKKRLRKCSHFCNNQFFYRNEK